MFLCSCAWMPACVHTEDIYKFELELDLCCIYGIKVRLECGTVVGTKLALAKIVLRRPFILTCLFPAARGPVRWGGVKWRLGQEKAIITDGAGICCHLPLGMKRWDMGVTCGPPWQSGRSKERLGSPAVWVSLLVPGSVKSPFWSCSYWWYTSLVEEQNLLKDVGEKNHSKCHDLHIAGGSSRSNRWNEKAKAVSHQLVTFTGQNYCCTRHSAKIKLVQW